MKRLLDCTATDFEKMNGEQLKQAIRASEGRVILSEMMTSVAPLYPNITNAELACAFGADLLLFNLFDVFAGYVAGYEHEAEATVIKEMKALTGRPIGINLEPIDDAADEIERLDVVSKGRTASEQSLQRAKELGFDFVCLTGNPKTGVTNRATIMAIKRARKIFGEEGLIIAGKMHGAGVATETGSTIITKEIIEQFISAGADVILMPAPGTIPGLTVDIVHEFVNEVTAKGALALLTIGTSQEGSDEETIRQIALNSKMAGAHMYHIGDAGFYGIAVPENIFTYSVAIRGRRHTYVRMATSIRR